MSKFLRFGFSAVMLLALCSSQALAVPRIFITTSGDVNGGGARGATPNVTVNPGETTDLYIWVDLEGASGTEWLGSWGLDVVASTPGVVEAVSSTLYNENYRLADNPSQVLDGTPRWTSTFGNGQLNVDGSGGASLVTDARGVAFNPTGPSGIAYRGDIVLPGQAAPAFLGPMLDPMYDDTNDAWLAQKITLRALAGAAGDDTGIVMKVGLNAFNINNSATPLPIHFGNTDVGVPMNVAGGTDGSIHAMITVAGGTGGDDPTVDFTAHDGTDLTGDVVINNVGGRFFTAGGATSGRINIVNYVGDGSGDLPLFFDLVAGDNAQQLVDDLNANANGEFTAALSTFSAPNAAGGGASTADIVITYPGIAAGTNAFIDFDFGAGNAVAAVGVPEPSSIALVGMSLIGLVGYGIRRRRSA